MHLQWVLVALSVFRSAAAQATYTTDVYASTAAPMVVGTANVALTGYTTYRLRVSLGPSQVNVYSIYGGAQEIPHVPPAWFAPSATSAKRPPPWNQVTGANATLQQSAMMYTICAPGTQAACAPGTAMWATVNASYQNALAAIAQPVALTSFLSLGPDTYCQGPACSQQVPSPSTGGVGTAITNWENGGALTLGHNPTQTTDFGWFWMDPSGPAAFQLAHGNFVGGPLIAQLTLPSCQAFFMRVGVQGKSAGGAADWQETAVWVQKSPSGACPAGMTGADCLTDVDECASNPCAGVAGSTSCWHGVDEYACDCGATVCASSTASGPAPGPAPAPCLNVPHASPPAGTVTATLEVNTTLDLTDTAAVDVFKTAFIADVAAALNVATSQVVINSVTAYSLSGRRRQLQSSGAIMVNFSVLPASDGTVVAPSALATAFSVGVTLPTVGASTAGAVSTPVVTAAPSPPPPPPPPAADDTDHTTTIVICGVVAIVLLGLYCKCCKKSDEDDADTGKNVETDVADNPLATADAV
jgi:hypothetical protein